MSLRVLVADLGKLGSGASAAWGKCSDSGEIGSPNHHKSKVIYLNPKFQSQKYGKFHKEISFLPFIGYCGGNLWLGAIEQTSLDLGI